MDAANESKHSSHAFGTFGGVFTPSILTILGVIMFMRANFVVGQAGILAALLILLIAKSITFLTGLSICAISTNTQVKGGGAYFLISRSLGPEFGGAIGLALFLAQALSVPFYILGFVESVVRSFPMLEPHFLLITLGTALMGKLTRMTRAAVLEVLGEDYVRTARAKGLPERVVVWRHVLRNALLPVVTIAGLQFGALLAGAIVTEKVFARPGLGTLLLEAIEKRNFEVVQGTVILIAFVYVAVNLATDLLYGIVDPRIRLR